jgi:hypothetical protein
MEFQILQPSLPPQPLIIPPPADSIPSSPLHFTPSSSPTLEVNMDNPLHVPSSTTFSSIPTLLSSNQTSSSSSTSTYGLRSLSQLPNNIQPSITALPDPYDNAILSHFKDNPLIVNSGIHTYLKKLLTRIDKKEPILLGPSTLCLRCRQSFVNLTYHLKSENSYLGCHNVTLLRYFICRTMQLPCELPTGFVHPPGLPSLELNHIEQFLSSTDFSWAFPTHK